MPNIRGPTKHQLHAYDFSPSPRGAPRVPLLGEEADPGSGLPRAPQGQRNGLERVHRSGVALGYEAEAGGSRLEIWGG